MPGQPHGGGVAGGVGAGVKGRWTATPVGSDGIRPPQREALSAKRFRASEEAFVDGERMGAFDAQPPACCSLRAADMERLLAFDLRDRRATHGHKLALTTASSSAADPRQSPLQFSRIESGTADQAGNISLRSNEGVSGAISCSSAASKDILPLV